MVHEVELRLPLRQLHLLQVYVDRLALLPRGALPCLIQGLYVRWSVRLLLEGADQPDALISKRLNSSSLLALWVEPRRYLLLSAVEILAQVIKARPDAACQC